MSLEVEKRKPLYPSSGDCDTCGQPAAYLALSSKVRHCAGRLYGKADHWLYCTEHARQAALEDPRVRSVAPLPATAKRAKPKKGEQQKWDL